MCSLFLETHIIPCITELLTFPSKTKQACCGTKHYPIFANLLVLPGYQPNHVILIDELSNSYKFVNYGEMFTILGRGEITYKANFAKEWGQFFMPTNLKFIHPQK